MDPNFSQNLYTNRDEIQNELKEFLDALLKENKFRVDSGMPYPVNKGYGEALDPLSASIYEAELFKKVAKIFDVANDQGKSLRIVIWHHYDYNDEFKKIAADSIKGIF